MQKDLAIIGQHILAFSVGGLVVLGLALTPLYPLAYGIIAAALAYVLLAGNGAAVIGDLQKIMSGGKANG